MKVAVALEPLVAVGYLLGGKVIQFAVALKQSTREISKSDAKSAWREFRQDPKEWRSI